MSHEVTGVTQNDDEVVVEANGKRFKGDFLIAGDGGRSYVRKALDIEFEGFTYPEHFLVAGTRYDFKAHMDICSVNYTADPDEWYVLLEIPDMWRIVAPVDSTVEPDEAMQERYLQNCLQNLLPRPEPYEIVVKAIYRVSQRVAATYRRGRAFLAGDAAHINNPLGGLGLNGGIHDAVNLTSRARRVWHGEAPESELDGYEPQRKPEAVSAIHGQTGRNKKLMEERDPEVRAKNLDEWRASAHRKSAPTTSARDVDDRLAAPLGDAAMKYMTGFGNEFATEAIAGALPQGQNSPKQAPLGLYAEQLSGTPFTAPRAHNRRSWLYRIRPSAMHRAYRRIDDGLIRSAPFTEAGPSPNRLRWDPLPLPSAPTDFIAGLVTICGNGDAAANAGMAVHIYCANRSMEAARVFVDADGELLLVPQEGGIRLVTELGIIEARPAISR